MDFVSDRPETYMLGILTNYNSLKIMIPEPFAAIPKCCDILFTQWLYSVHYVVDYIMIGFIRINFFQLHSGKDS